MVLEIIKKRRSVRDFRNDAVEEKYILEIIKAGQYAPTANNNRAIEFIVVKDAKLKQEIYEVAQPHQNFVKQAPVLIVPISNTQKTNLSIPDLSLASENMFLQATALGLGSIWKNFYPPVAEKIKEILDIPSHYHLVNAIAIGYPVSMPSPYEEQHFSTDKIYYEKYKNKRE